MSNPTISASAIGLPSRRLFLASGSVATVLGALTTAKLIERPPQMAAMIARYRAAREAFCEMCDIEDSTDDGAPEYAAVEARYKETLGAEEAAILDLLRHPPADLSEATMKAEYLLSANLFAEFTGEHVAALCQSFTAL